MKIKISCPVCSQRLRIPLSTKNLKITCPKCSSTFFYKIKVPDFIKNIKNFFSNVFNKKKIEGYTNYAYTDIEKGKKVKTIFIIWISIILSLFVLSVIFKSINDTSLKNKIINKTKNINFLQEKNSTSL